MLSDQQLSLQSLDANSSSYPINGLCCIFLARSQYLLYCLFKGLVVFVLRAQYLLSIQRWYCRSFAIANSYHKLLQTVDLQVQILTYHIRFSERRHTKRRLYKPWNCTKHLLFISSSLKASILYNTV